VTMGRDPAAPGGTPRSPRSSGRDLRRRERPGASGEEIADIGAICRTEAILHALEARRARDREPAGGQSGAAGSGGAVVGSGVSGGDPALAVLAALASDVDEHAELPCLDDPWQDDAFLRQIRAVCADSRVQGKAGAGICPAAPGVPGTPPVASITDQNHLCAGPSQASV
jgi:hypothetical protein